MSDRRSATEAGRLARADTRRTRELLLDTMADLLETKGLSFTLPDLARESGVATATVYRHFDDVHDLRETFYYRIVDDLADGLEALAETHHGRELFEATCRAWVERGARWARPGTFIRSAEGYLERVQRGERLTSRLHRILKPVVEQLIAERIIPDQDPDYAVLVWVTMFDERVFVDLESALGWSLEEIVTYLTATVIAALQHPAAGARPTTRMS